MSLELGGGRSPKSAEGVQGQSWQSSEIALEQKTSRPLTVNPLLPMSMNMNEWDRKHKQMGQRMQMNGTENTSKWDREHKQMGQRMQMNGTENTNEQTVKANRKQNMTMNERGSETQLLSHNT